jgi:TM2 domain-containing membrane protein YozV
MTLISNDTRALMQFQANKKSAGVAFVLWFCFGGIGAHRFYVRHYGVGASMLLLWIPFFLLLVATPASLVLTFPFLLWVLLDGFFIPKMIRKYNSSLIEQCETND